MLRKNMLVWLGVALALSLPLAVSSQTARQGRSAAKTPTDPAVAEGEKLFTANCAICHFSNSTAKKVGPGMKGLYKRGQYADGKKVDDDSMRSWIEKGSKNMPGFAAKLKPDEIRALIAYLKTL